MQPVALDAAVKSLADAEAAGTVFNVLIDALAGAAPRGAIFLVRQDEIRGWSSFGYSAEATRKQRAFSSPVHGGRLGGLIARNGTDADKGPGGDPDFGQRGADESFLATIAVKGKPIAVIQIERASGERPWDCEMVTVLGAFAQLRLELTLAQRRLQMPEGRLPAAAVRPSTTSPAPAVVERHDSATGSSPAACHDAAACLEEADAVEQVGEFSEATQARATPHEEPNLDLAAARRFARLVATDIRLYNEEAVASGRLHRDLAERLSTSIVRGKETFVARHGYLGEAGLDLLLDAFVAVLASGDADLLPESLLK